MKMFVDTVKLTCFVNFDFFSKKTKIDYIFT